MTYNILTTFRLEEVNIPTIDRLVKMCNGRFKFNPKYLKPYSLIDVEFKNIPDYKRFDALQSITKQPFFK